MSVKPFIDIEKIDQAEGITQEPVSTSQDQSQFPSQPEPEPECTGAASFQPVIGATPSDIPIPSTPSISVPPPPTQAVSALPDDDFLRRTYETYIRQKGTYNQQELLIRGKILLLLTVYPRLSPTMIQMGLGPTLPTGLWRPVFNSMLIEGVIKQYEVLPNGGNRGTTPVYRSKNFVVVEMVAIEDREKQAATYKAALEAQIDAVMTNKSKVIANTNMTDPGVSIPSCPPAEKIPLNPKRTSTVNIGGIKVPSPKSKVQSPKSKV